MEYLDYYDEEGNYLGYETREKVHELGLWHKTVHNWLYTNKGEIVFQIRKDLGKFYTTSSGHVRKGETIEEAFSRETEEEIGLKTNPNEAKPICFVTWIKDTVKKDGRIIKDRAKSTFLMSEYKGDFNDFNFDPEEVTGVVFLDAKKVMDLFNNKITEMDAIYIINENGKNKKEERKITIDNFLVFENETALDKYGKVLEAVIKETSK